MHQLSTRHIGDPTNQGQDISESEGSILQILALTFATVSVASSFLAFYWFVRMRRSFRHDLIMLLIQSDMFKALWFMIFPIVVFLHGPIADDSTFCQISGFFLSVGIEASGLRCHYPTCNISVLMVAVHSALYIFRPKSSAGEGGLYPYRRIAYIIWIVFPLLTASLAFVNNKEAYVTQGTNCYLPVRPFWYRLALSWIPRYIIFVTILTVYVSIYFYVRFRFRGFENSQDSFNSTARARPSQIRRSGPPPLTLNGLVPEPTRPSAAFVARGRKQSASTLNSLANVRNHAHQFMWTAVFHSRNRASSRSPPSEVSTDSFAGTSTTQPASETTTPALFTPQQTLNPMPPPQFRNNWRESFIRRLSLDSNGSIYASPISTDLNPVPQAPHDSEGPDNLFGMNLVNSQGQNLEVIEMIRTREKIRRQLRFLFIYPLVYLAMWIIPFISHILQFNDHLAINQPFAISAFTTICACAQGAVDCWLFSTREKPWKHIPGTDGTFFGSLKFWVIFWGKGEEGQGRGPGKTRNEMAREARQAYKRRDEELAQRRFEAQAGSGMVGVRGRSDRSWWDVEGIDGLGPVGVGPGITAMSPVQEEFYIPSVDGFEGTPSLEDIRENSPPDTSAEDSENNEKRGKQ
ncbi:hypothetical protein DSL72_004748 [Monilinia vaccinii-corymbosi]|uniref:G-protein coupled receptors family 1 profile domain-containing protein n=1 Tax=Monilinia vaccinii-corymbosi TaxID=61207 RepID=A0A8A3P4K8_9HELO|nr:hypothetical protein DSL72_004748 [Monilinia vaccinii-corymbosi]